MKTGGLNLSVLSPAMCMLCGMNACKDELPVCDLCLYELQSLMCEKCVSCGKTADRCQCPRPENLKFLFFYGGMTSKHVIYLLKGSADPRYTDFLSRLLVRYSGIRRNLYDVVTYVPRSGKAKRKYGYDQARLIARSVAAELGLPLVATLERRGKGEQKLLSAAERRKSLAGQYFKREDIAREYIGKRWLIVDDVCTTGSTLHVCAKILRDTGVASAVTALTLAKTCKK